MKKIYYLLTTVLILTFSQLLSAQDKRSVGIGVSGLSAVSEHALLQIDAKNKGLLLPRMTSLQRAGIPSPPDGLIVFQTDGEFGYYRYDLRSGLWKSFYKILGGVPDTVRRIPNRSIATVKFKPLGVSGKDIKNNTITGGTNIRDSGVSGKDIENLIFSTAHLKKANIDVSRFSATKRPPENGDFMTYGSSEWEPKKPVAAYTYQGNWDATGNSPLLSDGTLANNGNFYVVDNAGTQTFGGKILNFSPGDWIMCVEGIWTKIGQATGVNSVFGRSTDVVAKKDDYTWENLKKNTLDINKIRNARLYLIEDVASTALNLGKDKTIIRNSTFKWSFNYDRGSGLHPVTTSGVAIDAIDSSRIKAGALNNANFTNEIFFHR